MNPTVAFQDMSDLTLTPIESPYPLSPRRSAGLSIRWSDATAESINLLFRLSVNCPFFFDNKGEGMEQPKSAFHINMETKLRL